MLFRSKGNVRFYLNFFESFCRRGDAKYEIEIVGLAQGGRMKRPTSRGAQGASISQELPNKSIVPEDKKPRKVEETCEQRRKEISR